ncbi:hypothetical protein NVP1189B_37 [Vibrio phage 1.189.B._10N.286.51.B5]|nr:hypothetical protein NVP1189B_37 [Vibrio phage 1.189.B._10N.286.51.B5]AUR93929.1 hypothetical protein NVP1189C_37 [Vibrio phage 1.189.C._10N.286.51.B5]AUR93995.1 hypothetical protein NVP1189O_37 [Vibrio phage 1.189.O._10N.286.51.B5]
MSKVNCYCKVCGKGKYLKPSHLKKIKNPTCSTACAVILKSKIYSGDKNPNFGNRGKNSKLFKGDLIEHCGYLWRYIPDHPLVGESTSGRVREHRIVAEMHLLTSENSIEIDGKMYLKPELDVHHINHNKLDNRPENLQVLTKSEHRALHNADNPRERGLDGKFIKNTTTVEGKND